MGRIFVLLTVGALMALMLMVSAIPAFAVANPNASCNGIGGSTETALGGRGARAEIAHEFTGADISFSAHQHSGSVEACFG